MDVLNFKKKRGSTAVLPTPSELKWSISDLDADGSGRNQNGDMFRDRVAVKRKLECTWPPLLANEMSELLNAVSDIFFELTYPDAMTGSNRTMTCYMGDRSSPIMRPETDGKWLWGGLSMNFVER